MRWTRQCWRDAVGAGRVSREQSTGARTNSTSAFAKASADSHLSPAKPRGEDGCCVRQNRVVLAPVAGVKLAEAKSTQPSLISPHPPTTVTRGIRRRGEHGISRKAIAQGMPETASAELYARVRILRTILHTRPRVQRAPGIPCSLFVGGTTKCKAGIIHVARRRSYVWKWHRNRHTLPVIPAHAGDPVRRGFSAPTLASLEYWIARSGRAGR